MNVSTSTTETLFTPRRRNSLYPLAAIRPRTPRTVATMNPVTLTVSAHIVGMVLLILGGIAAIRYGYQLSMTGAGSKPGKMIVQLQSVKVSAHSLGPVVMATAVAWGWLGYRACPSLDASAGGIKVASYVDASKELLAGALTAPVIATSVSAESSKMFDSVGQRHQLRAAFVQGFDQCSLIRCASLRGRPAKLDPTTLEIKEVASGGLQLRAVVRSDTDSALVSYNPEVLNGKVTLQPVSAMPGPPKHLTIQ